MNSHQSSCIIVFSLFLTLAVLPGCLGLDGEPIAPQESAESWSPSAAEATGDDYSPTAECFADCLNGSRVSVSCSGTCSGQDQYCSATGLTLGGRASCGSGGGIATCPPATCQPTGPTCGQLQFVHTSGTDSTCNAADDRAAEVARDLVGYNVCEERIVRKQCKQMNGYFESQIRYEYRYELL